MSQKFKAILLTEMGEHLLKSRPDLHSSLMTSRGDFSV